MEELEELVEIIEKSSLFDSEWYLSEYPDVALSGLNPVVHYLKYGILLLRNPGITFNTRSYLKSHPEIAGGPINPLVHFIKSGKFEIRTTYAPSLMADIRRRLKDLPIFDEAAYCATYSDNHEIGNSALDHYLQFGEPKGRCAGPLFDPQYYRNRYSDIARAGLSPLTHFLQHGAKEGRSPCAALELLPMLAEDDGVSPIDYIRTMANDPHRFQAHCERYYKNNNIPAQFQPSMDIDTAVVVHAFYRDVWLEITSRLKHLGGRFDLYVSVPETVDADFVEEIKRDWPQAIIAQLPNRGRDVAPFLHFLNAGVFYRYRYVCKVHTKKSLHRKDGEAWRRGLYDPLLGSIERVSHIKQLFDNDHTVGIVGPEGYLTSPTTYLGANAARIASLRERLGITDTAPLQPFFAGSMFWFRPSALAPLERLKIDLEEFEEEAGQVDGTLGHAIERVFALTPYMVGQRLLEADAKSDFERLWYTRPCHVAFAVSESSLETRYGDVFTAYEMGQALQIRFGWTFELRGPGCWYNQDRADIVIAMLHDFKPQCLVRDDAQRPVLIGWARNWFDEWAAVGGFDLFLCSSQRGAQEIASKQQVTPTRILRIATNAQSFYPNAQDNDKRENDYVFTGSLWGERREIVDALDPTKIPYKGAIYGLGWSQIKGFTELAKGSLDYTEMPTVYRESWTCVDDANSATKRFGSINSRVFDALASGCLVLTNGHLGAEEVFADALPTYRNGEELRRLIEMYMTDEVARREKAAELRTIVCSKHTYDVRAFEMVRALEPMMGERLSFAIKAPVPSAAEAEEWGDYHFALALIDSLHRLNYSARLDLLPDWYEDPRTDVTLVLRGLSQYRPRPDSLNLMWNISHSDKVSDEEYESYDYVFVASVSHARTLADRLTVPVTALLQCTDRARFGAQAPRQEMFESTPAVLFVGNSRNVFRPIIKDAIEVGLSPTVYGTRWAQFIDAKYLRGEHFPNSQLPHAYRRAGIVLNDHWHDMAKLGFLSNRLFDAGAAGACIITDPVEGLTEVFGDSISTYQNKQELKHIVEGLLADPEARIRKGQALRRIVLESHTFDHRVATIIEVVSDLRRQHAVGVARPITDTEVKRPGLEKAAAL